MLHFLFQPMMEPVRGVERFECRLDGGSYSTCKSPKTYSGLAVGNHAFAVRVIDKAGHVSAPKTHSWTIQPPSAPVTTITMQPSNPHKMANVEFRFSANDPQAQFSCKLDSGNYASCSSPFTANNLADGNHSFAVRASLSGVTGNPASYSFLVDVNPAVLTLNTPVINMGDASFSFSANDGAGSGVERFECRLDNGAYAACQSPRAYTGLAVGAHSFAVRVVDKAGHLSAPKTHSWTVQAPPAPVTTITMQPANPHKSANIEFRFTSNDPQAQFGCSLDGANYSSCSSPFTANNLADGNHSFAVRAANTAGIVGNPETYNFLLDANPAVLTLGTPVVSGPDASFSFSADDGAGSGVDRFECRLDNGSYGTCQSPKDYTGLAVGMHDFYLRVVDKAGHVSQAMTYSWEVKAPVVNDYADLSWDANSESDLAGYIVYYGTSASNLNQQVDVGLPQIQSGRVSHRISGLSPGMTYYFEVTAYDTSNNESPPSNRGSKTIPAGNVIP